MGGALLQLMAYGHQPVILAGNNFPIKKNFSSRMLVNLYSRNYANFEINLDVSSSQYNITFQPDINLSDLNNNNLFEKTFNEKIAIINKIPQLDQHIYAINKNSLKGKQKFDKSQNELKLQIKSQLKSEHKNKKREINHNQKFIKSQIKMNNRR